MPYKLPQLALKESAPMTNDPHREALEFMHEHVPEIVPKSYMFKLHALKGTFRWMDKGVMSGNACHHDDAHAHIEAAVLNWVIGKDVYIFQHDGKWTATIHACDSHLVANLWDDEKQMIALFDTKFECVFAALQAWVGREGK